MVLLRFLDEVYPGLAADEQQAFEALLSAQDPELAAWLLGGEAPPPQWRVLVGRIRAQWR